VPRSFEPEASDGANKGLHIIHDLLVPVKKTFPNVSTADIWAMSGAVAVEFAGGPAVPFELGRSDAPTVESATVPPNGRLPDAAQGASHLREVFGRMGFNDDEIVALSGGHTLGRCHKVRSGFDGAWTQNPLKFDNSYFTNLMTLEWTKREWDGPIQYTDPSGTLTMLETDLALKTDDSFKVTAQLYADDEAAFFTAFAAAYGKLLALGCPHAAQPGATAAAAAACPHATAAFSAEFRDHCMHGSIEHCKAAVDKGADVQDREKNSGRTALHKACYWNHTHMMDWYVKIEAKSARGKRVRVARNCALLARSCAPFTLPPLHRLTSFARRMLNELKIKIDVQDYNGDTALHDAAMFGHSEIIAALLAAGADRSIKNRDGRTAADVAVFYEKVETAASLKPSTLPELPGVVAN